MPVSRLSIRLLVPFASNLSRPRARGGDDSLANGGHSALQLVSAILHPLSLGVERSPGHRFSSVGLPQKWGMSVSSEKPGVPEFFLGQAERWRTWSQGRDCGQRGPLRDDSSYRTTVPWYSLEEWADHFVRAFHHPASDCIPLLSVLYKRTLDLLRYCAV